MEKKNPPVQMMGILCVVKKLEKKCLKVVPK